MTDECDYLGRPLPPPVGADVRQHWRQCHHPDTPLGPVVCGCNGCGPRCPGYTLAGVPSHATVPATALESMPDVRQAAARAGSRLPLSVTPGQHLRSLKGYPPSNADSPPHLPPGAGRVLLPAWTEHPVWVRTAQLLADAQVLAAALPADTAAIVAIPRSGMLAASVIATHLHLPLLALAREGLANLAIGSRSALLALPGSGPVALPVDPVSSGAAMRRAVAVLHGPGSPLRQRSLLRAVVYARPEALTAVDLAVRPLPDPHLLEWSLLNSGQIAGYSYSPLLRRGLATDLDGVLIHDADTARLTGASVGQPYLPIRHARVRAVITGRPASQQTETQALLRRLRVQHDGLYCCPDGGDMIAHKIQTLHNLRVSGYIESDPQQADAIHAATGLLVICTVDGRVRPPRTQGVTA